jgi:hypothetical protein
MFEKRDGKEQNAKEKAVVLKVNMVDDE